MKRLETKVVEINDVKYYISPFGAFYASNLSGEIIALIAPLIGSLAPLVGKNGDNNGEEGGILDMKVEDALPAITEAFNSLSGDKIEQLMKKLLINQKNIAVEYTDEDGNEVAEKLDYDLANELFCMGLQDMYMLAFEVIKLNYSGFFKKAPDLFGKADGVIKIRKKK